MTPTQRAALLDRAAELTLALTGRDPHKPGVLDVDYLRVVRVLLAQHEASIAAAEVEAHDASEQSTQLLGAVGELAVENATLLTTLAELVDALAAFNACEPGGLTSACERLMHAETAAAAYVEAQRKGGGVQDRTVSA